MTIIELITARFIAAVEEAQKQDVLPQGDLPPVNVERPQNPDNGDFATSLPLRLAKLARKAPTESSSSFIPILPSTAWDCMNMGAN